MLSPKTLKYGVFGREFDFDSQEWICSHTRGDLTCECIAYEGTLTPRVRTLTPRLRTLTPRVRTLTPRVRTLTPQVRASIERTCQCVPTFKS